MNAPELPPGCQWSDTVDDVNAVLDAGQIPLLRPDDADRANRWARVMHWYEPDAHNHNRDRDSEIPVPPHPAYKENT